MDPILMVVLIVLISVGAGVVNNYLKLKANSASDIASDADFQKVLGEVDRLKERVRVHRWGVDWRAVTVASDERGERLQRRAVREASGYSGERLEKREQIF